MVDIKTLERLADQMERDSRILHGLNSAAVASISVIIKDSIGAPLNWPSYVAARDAAEEYSYSGSRKVTDAFMAGAKWAIEHYDPTKVIKLRYG